MGKELEFCVQPRLKDKISVKLKKNNLQCKKPLKLENLCNLFSNRIQLNIPTKQIPQQELCKIASTTIYAIFNDRRF